MHNGEKKRSVGLWRKPSPGKGKNQLEGSEKVASWICASMEKVKKSTSCEVYKIRDEAFTTGGMGTTANS